MEGVADLPFTPLSRLHPFSPVPTTVLQPVLPVFRVQGRGQFSPQPGGCLPGVLIFRRPCHLLQAGLGSSSRCPNNEGLSGRGCEA